MSRVRRWAPWVLLVAVAVAVLAVGATRSTHPTLDQKVMHLAGQVRCPVCEGQSAAQSDAAASVQIRDQIRKELLAGEANGQILAGLVAAYGPGILEKPRASGVALAVWIVPVAAVVAALVGLAMAFARWRSRGLAGAPSIEDVALVDRALAGGGGPPAGGEEARPGDTTAFRAAPLDGDD